MSTPTGKLAFAYQSIARLEQERDTLRSEVERQKEVMARLLQVVTTNHESKETLAARVRNILEDYQ